MNKSSPAVNKTRAAVCSQTVLCVLILTLMAGLPITAGAQQAAERPAQDVPDNYAPPPAPGQPLPFSHKKHLAFGLVCQMCHTNPDAGALMTYPATETCMSCHRTVAADKPAIIELQKYSDSGQAVPWLRAYEVTPGVNWSHRKHLDAGAQCETCHGDVSQFDDTSERKATDAMASCIGCHQSRGADAKCATCHRWPADQDLDIEPH